MGALVDYLDRTFYPDKGEGWDDVLFRSVVLRHAGADSDVLDLGAGRGANPLIRFKDDVRSICGVDVDPIVLKNRDVDEARVIEGNVIPYEDERFDCVIASYVLEHLENPEGVFREVARVLRPGGAFVSRTPNRRHYVPLIARLTPHRFHVYVNERRGRPGLDTFPTYYRANTPATIAQLARSARMSDIVEISLHDGRPEYLRFNALTYVAGLVYERVASSTDALSWMRPLLISVVRKPDPSERA